MRRSSLLFVTLGGLAVAGFLAVQALDLEPARKPATHADAPLLHVPLTGMDGGPATLAQNRGAFQLVFFGYLTCPDVCPTSMAYLARELESVPDLAARTKVVFVSVDPAHDTPERLKEYVTHFDPRFTGLTGAPESLRQVAKDLGAHYERQPDGTFVHTASFFLLDPEGRLVDTVSPPFEKGMVADLLKRRVSAGAH